MSHQWVHTWIQWYSYSHQALVHNSLQTAVSPSSPYPCSLETSWHGKRFETPSMCQFMPTVTWVVSRSLPTYLKAQLEGDAILGLRKLCSFNCRLTYFLWLCWSSHTGIVIAGQVCTLLWRHTKFQFLYMGKLSTEIHKNLAHEHSNTRKLNGSNLKKIRVLEAGLLIWLSQSHIKVNCRRTILLTTVM